MGWLSRVKDVGGNGAALPSLTVTTGAALNIPDNIGVAKLTAAGSGAHTVASFTTAKIRPGRIVHFVGTDNTNTVTFADTPLSSTADGKIHSGGMPTLGLYDWATFVQNENGSWSDRTATIGQVD